MLRRAANWIKSAWNAWGHYGRLQTLLDAFGWKGVVVTAIVTALAGIGSFLGTGVDLVQSQGWAAKYVFGIAVALVFATLVLVVAKAIPAVFFVFGWKGPWLHVSTSEATAVPLTAEATAPACTGAPIGFLNFSYGSSANGPSYGLPRFSAKNVTEAEVRLSDIVVVNKQSGVRLPTQISTATGEWISAREAEIAPPGAEFVVQAQLPRQSGPGSGGHLDGIYPLAELRDRWSDLYIHVEHDNDRYDVDVSHLVMSWIDLNLKHLEDERPKPRPPGLSRKPTA